MVGILFREASRPRANEKVVEYLRCKDLDFLWISIIDNLCCEDADLKYVLQSEFTVVLATSVKIFFE